jgi:carboxypeptidase D
MTDYLNLESSKIALHAENTARWGECNRNVYSSLMQNDIISTMPMIENLLSKIDVMMFVGLNDILCNIIGISNMISVMNWNGQIGFKHEPNDFMVDGVKRGKIINENRLSLITIENASHMVPYDAPDVAYEILNTFMSKV